MSQLEKAKSLLEALRHDDDGLFAYNHSFKGWCRVEWIRECENFVFYYGAEMLPPHLQIFCSDFDVAAKELVDYAPVEEWVWVSELS